MKNSNNPQPRGKKDNQLIFVEYEKPTKEGHLITVVDSYHNTLGRIHRSYNEQAKKYEFTAYDHTGKPLYMKSEKVWELKNEFTKNRTQLLEDAHQRRIESKGQAVRAAEKAQPGEVKKTPEKVTPALPAHAQKEAAGKESRSAKLSTSQDKPVPEKKDEEKTIESKRAEELDELRNSEVERDNAALER